MRKRNNYNIYPVKYYSKIWKLPARDIKDFIEIYEYNNKIWQFRRFKKWFSVSCHFNLTYKKWKKFVQYYKVYTLRKGLKLPPNAKITREFINRALKE